MLDSCCKCLHIAQSLISFSLFCLALLQIANNFVIAFKFMAMLYAIQFVNYYFPENTTNTKLMGEYEKYQELQARSQRLQEDYERQLQEMEGAREKALQELTDHYERKLHEKQIEIEKVLRYLIGLIMSCLGK